MDINRMEKGFTRLAPVYDFMADAVFGNSIIDSQSAFLHIIPAHSRVLVLAGGTGRILKRIDSLGIPLQVDFVDTSEGMLQKAKLQQLRNLDVSFSKDLPKRIEMYDIAIIAFFFDMLRQKDMVHELRKLKSRLKPDGKILFTDFQLSGGVGKGTWQNLLLIIMYGFFKLATGIKTLKLLRFEKIFLQEDFLPKNRKLFYSDFIASTVYVVNSRPGS